MAIDNTLVAKVLITNKLATQEQLKAEWSGLNSETNIAQILVDKGLLAQKTCDQLLAYVNKLEEEKAVKKAVLKTSESNDSVNVESEKPKVVTQKIAEPVVEELEEKQEEKKEEAMIEVQAEKKPEVELSSKPKEKSAGKSLPSDFVGDRGDGTYAGDAPELSADISLNEMLMRVRMMEGSDLHLSAESPIKVRRFTKLETFGEPLSAEQVEKLIRKNISAEKLVIFEETGDVELIYVIKGGGRYRVTLMKHRSGWDFTARAISQSIPTLEAMKLPEVCAGLTKWAQGLVLVTGPVGCGKTTTLSSLVQMVNEERKDHIITIESPIEIIYPDSNCQMTQREVGIHTLSQANALKGALRQDPDILVVSELRDLESIQLAVSAAETGHLVFGTMNTTDAPKTISRLIDSFPPEEQEIMRSMISESLRGVISQQMIPKKNGEGVVMAFEVLKVTFPVANIIRKNDMHQIESAMMTGKGEGMILLDDSLKALVDEGLIEGEEAYYRASNPKKFVNYIEVENYASN